MMGALLEETECLSPATAMKVLEAKVKNPALLELDRKALDAGRIYIDHTVAMGAVAGSAIEHGGAATGIIPEFLTAKERPRRLAQEQIVTRDMHERKRIMFDRADAFVALPGGIGTLEELIEQMTWAQLLP